MGNNEHRQSVEQILTAVDRAANLTKNLLAFSRKQVMNPVPVKLNGIIRRVEKLLSRLISENIEIKTVLADEEMTVMADSGQIEQVLLNLATNARDSMPRGGALTIETKSVDINEAFIQMHDYGKPGRCALLSITDTGAGMDEETRRPTLHPRVRRPSSP